MEFLIGWIEARWQPGMSWRNYGSGAGKWDLDHKRPCASFDFTDPAQLRACFNYSNLQPMWSIENRVKQDKLL